MSKPGLRLAAAAFIAAALSTTTMAAAASQDGTKITLAGPPSRVPAVHERELEEKLEKPLIPEDVAAWSDALQRQFDDHPQFNAVEINDDRTAITVWWHGSFTPELETAIATPLSIEVEVKPTAHSPAELKASVERVFKDESLGVSYASIRPDGSGIDVTTTRESRSATSRADVAQIAGVPVASTTGEVTPYTNRQFDEYLIGGANYARWQDGNYSTNCTSGYSIAQKSDASVRGFVTAAHCGAVGSVWGPIQNNTIYAVGTMVERNTSIDTAVVQSSAGPFQSYVYTGPHTSGTVTPINGNRSAPVNAEICYSGSYTGLVCGNFVTSKSASWNLGGDLTSVSGMRTDRTNATVAAGQGDSGGPGYWLTVENGVVKRYAAAIISAGPNASFGGCPGLRADRLCGPSVLAGETWRFANTSNWQITSIP